MEVIKFIGLIFAVWYFVEGSEPIEWLKSLIGIDYRTDQRNIWLKVLQGLVNCCLCSGFWIGLFYYQSIELACITGISSEIFSRLWNRFIKPL